ncbi:MAG: hypothetical protein IJT32_07065 [Lachnospiraceae bacterium]|nr:hypothetical protein [Lachnospiraceae bacterium]
MAGKLQNLLFNNIGLKLLAFLFACMLWLVVINVDDPTQSRNFTSTVSIVNDDVLTGQGKYYEIVNGNNTVTFRVTARRSVIEKLSGSDFTATADLNYLEGSGRVPIDISANRYSNQLSISSKLHYLLVTVGEKLNSNFIVKGTTQGKPANGFDVNSVTVTPNVITVDGPKDIVSKISSVIAVCDITGMSTDVSESTMPLFYDADGNEIVKDKLSVNVETVEVAVDMVMVKEVPIDVQTGGQLAEGLELESITANPSSIRVKGESEKMNDLTSIMIPPTVIDLNTINGNFETSVDIGTYLPDGVTVDSSRQATVRIAVKLVDVDTREYAIPTANLKIDNVKAGCTAAFTDEMVKVQLTGLVSALDAVDPHTMKGRVNAEGLDEGKHIVEAVLSLEDNVTVGAVACEITIAAEKPEEEAPPQEQKPAEAPPDAQAPEE